MGHSGSLAQPETSSSADHLVGWSLPYHLHTHWAGLNIPPFLRPVVHLPVFDFTFNKAVRFPSVGSSGVRDGSRGGTDSKLRWEGFMVGLMMVKRFQSWAEPLPGWASWGRKDFSSGRVWGMILVLMQIMSEHVCCGCRCEALQVVLDAASGSHADTRNKAVRLIANKLFAQPQLQDTIAAFARQMLFKLTATAATSATAATAVATGASDTAALGAKQPQDPSAALPASQGDPTPTSQPPSAPQQHQQHQYQSEEDGTRFAGLFCALCTKQQTLLRDLLLVYGRAAEGSKAAIEAVAAGNDCSHCMALYQGVTGVTGDVAAVAKVRCCWRLQAAIKGSRPVMASNLVPCLLTNLHSHVE